MLVGVLLFIVSTIFRPLVISPDQGFDYWSQVGIAEISPDGSGCLTIRDASLTENSPVDIVLPDKPQVHAQAVIVRKSSKPCPHDVELDPGASSYLLRMLATKLGNGLIAFAVTGFSGKFQLRDGLVRADLSGNGVEDSFRSCTSTEGLHFTVWNGEPLKGARKWHRYHYLGYDVDPDCTEKDY